MYQLGIATNQLTLWFIILVVILVLLIIFIFFGVSAFSVGGTFSSVVNSSLPVGAGVGVSRKTPLPTDSNSFTKRIRSVVDKILVVPPQ